MSRDDVIDAKYIKDMNDLAKFLDGIFNPGQQGTNREVCFVLLITPFEAKGRTNYISNGNRPDIIAMMREFIARSEAKDKTNEKPAD